MVSPGQIRSYCGAIARAFEPEKIILFGSHAYGRPREDSDVDVLIVMRRARRHGRRPSLTIRRKVSTAFPVDILVKEPDEIIKRLQGGDSILREIVEKGRIMYEAGHA